MLNPCYPAPIWLIWKELPLSEKLPFLFLCVVGGYSFFLAATVLRFQNTATVGRFRKRIRNLQKATVAAFYLFGLGLFANLQFSYCIIGGDRSVPIGWLVVRNFQLHFAFADNVFLILLIVHVVQWFLANRVSALRSQLSL